MNLEYGLIFLLFAFATAKISEKDLQESATSKKKDGRLFSLFSLVTFQNSQCTGQSDKNMKGTCYTSSECNSRGGTTDGNCAAGFGVCCMVIISTCGGTVNKNLTYIQNAGFPSGLATLTQCSYTVTPVQSDICQLRLDFNVFTLAFDKTTPATCGGTTADAFTVTSPTGATIPTICGTNSNQHMYVETGTSSAPTTIAFTFGTATTATAVSKTWKILVSQIECWNPSKAPTDCRQFFTGTSGKFQSYNFAGGSMLSSLNYNNCFRQEQGYCSIDFSTSSVATPTPFSLGIAATATAGGVGTTGCPGTPTSIILIPKDQPGAGAAAGNTIYCGLFLVTTSGQTTSGIVRQLSPPFTLGVISTAAAAQTGTGFNLVYNQIPCGTL